MFEPIELTWKGRNYVIPPSRVLRAIATVEGVITLHEVTGSAEKIPVAKISMAFGALMRFAGANVSDEEIYASLFTDGKADNIVTIMTALLMVMIPKSIRDKLDEAVAKAAGRDKPGATEEGKEPAPTSEAS